ncbi:hypothetical protein ASPCAL12634 [Aspergillus calidoustus]|uniref:Copper-fist domain-containing protein n=1 Tax=Aspergillus calidoustus TaxID=454130 RepID=A0A0U5GCK1_ASPCI|nr:hypothetical protein ASPCAL12634 [Aspergillus calidoustus]
MLINGEKWACEACIRGHRAASCSHSERPLIIINKKGRPVSQCLHCRSLRESRSAHVKCGCGNTNRAKNDSDTQNSYPQCNCARGERCVCALKKGPFPELVPKPSRPHSPVHEEGRNTLAQPESMVAALHEDYPRYPGQFNLIQMGPSASAPEFEISDQHTGLQINSAEDSLPANSVISPADLSSFTDLSSAMAPDYSAPTALDNLSVHQTVVGDLDLNMSLLPAVNFPIMTASAGSMNNIDSENLYREDMFTSTNTRFTPGLTGADSYTTYWEGLHPDLFSIGNTQLLDYVPHDFAPYDLCFPALLLPNSTGDVEELEASSNHGNEGIS